MNPDHDPSFEQLSAAAADWLAKRDRGFTPREQDEFLQWLREDVRHRDVFADQESAWVELDALAHWRPEHSARPNPDLLVRLKPTRRWTWAAGIAALAAVLVVGAFLRRPSSMAATSIASTPQAAAAADFTQKALEDGSIIDINRGGRVEVRYTAMERRVWLTEGEAHFTVAKNPQRPFIVRAGRMDVRAVGTAFDIRVGKDETEVLVTEGVVQVMPPPGVEAVGPLRAGQRLQITDDNRVMVSTVSSGEMAEALAWQPRMLEFDSTRLADVVATFNRHNRVQLEIGDPELSDLAIGASFRSNNVEGFVRLLESGFGIRAERGEDRIVFHRAPR